MGIIERLCITKIRNLDVVWARVTKKERNFREEDRETNYLKILRFELSLLSQNLYVYICTCSCVE